MIRLDVTLRKSEEQIALEEEIERLTNVIKSKENEIKRMSEFAALYLVSLDQLKEAKERLDKAGMDSSFIKLR